MKNQSPSLVQQRVASYSRVVRVLKVALPLMAVVLLSTIFLVQEDDGLDGGLVFSSADRKTLGDGLTVNGPRLAGTTRDGTGFVLSAARAVPDQADISLVEFYEVSWLLRYQNRGNIEFTAQKAAARVPQRLLDLSGGVSLTTAAGYQVETSDARADLDAGTFETLAPVAADGPLGKIEAGRLYIGSGIDVEGQSTDTARIVFDQGVRMRFQPEGFP